jgi:hypothetical protein
MPPLLRNSKVGAGIFIKLTTVKSDFRNLDFVGIFSKLMSILR